jgi:hypothetical protein
MSDSLRADGCDEGGGRSIKAFAPFAEGNFTGEEGTTSCIDLEIDRGPV